MASLLNAIYIPPLFICDCYRIIQRKWRARAKSASSSQETLIKRARPACESVPAAFSNPSGKLKSSLDALPRKSNGANSDKSLASGFHNFLSRTKMKIIDKKFYL